MDGVFQGSGRQHASHRDETLNTVGAGIRRGSRYSGRMKKHIAGADAPFEVCWDNLGIPHIYAATVADAYRGMGYVEGHERLWQIHLSCLYANGNAASAMGERFVRQDALHRAFGVPANYPIPDS